MKHESFIKLRPGDKVKFFSDWNVFDGGWPEYVNDNMREFEGKIVTVKTNPYLWTSDNEGKEYFAVRIEECSRGWNYCETLFEGFATSPVGLEELI